ncbi:MAG: tetratricopeptide repeat protein [Acidiferrobacterales bacterium]
MADKFNKLHRSVSHTTESDLQGGVSIVANQMFGPKAIYVNVKTGLARGELVTIPSGYVLDLSEAVAPKLFVLKVTGARHAPFAQLAVELFQFVAGFDEHQSAIGDYLRNQIAQDTEGLARLQAACQAAANGTLNEYLDHAVHGGFRGLVVVDEAREELYRVLAKINADFSVLELKTYEAADGSRLYQIDTLWGAEPGAGTGVWIDRESESSDGAVEHTVLAHAGDHETANAQLAAVPGEMTDVEPAAPGVTEASNRVAERFPGQDNHAEMKPFLKWVVRIQEKALGPEHPELVGSLERLAACYQAEGRHAKAKSLYKWALRIQKHNLGPEHPELVGSLERLAACYQAEGRHAKAKSLYKWTLRIQEQQLGPEHPGLAANLDVLARLYRVLGKNRKAELLHKRALAICEKTLGRSDLHVAIELESYASLLSEMKRPAEAAGMAARAKAIRAQHGG